MKTITKYILVLSICMLGSYNSVQSMSTVKLFASEQTQSVMAQSSLNIKRSVSNVKRGGAGLIVIQGAPNTRYSIKTSYKLGDKTIPILQLRTTDKTGEATFNWVVNEESIPGTYEASIYGGGNTLKTTHIVLP
jgi:hypothetical protein